MAAKWKATNSWWEMRLRASERVAEVYSSDGVVTWVGDVLFGDVRTEAAAKRAAERALVKYGRKLVKAGGGE